MAGPCIIRLYSLLVTLLSLATFAPTGHSMQDLSWLSSVDRHIPFVRSPNHHWSDEPFNNQSTASVSCTRDLLHIDELLLTHLTSSRPLPDWLVTLIDSVGKPSSGIKVGAVLWPGSFGECVNGVRSTPPSPLFTGRYCSLYWSVKISNGSITVPVNQGICVPSTCNSQNIQHHTELVNRILLRLLPPRSRELFTSHVQLSGVYCHPLEGERSLNTSGKVSLALLTFMVSLSFATTIALLVLFAKKETRYEAFGETATTVISTSTDLSHTSMSRELLSCFNIGDNLNILVNGAKSTGNSGNGNRNGNYNLTSGHISCLSGIRFLSMAWVILCHSYLFSQAFTNNLLDLLADVKKSFFAFVFILNGSFCVDSFFLLSGCLCSYKLFQQPSRGRESETSESEENSNFRYYSHSMHWNPFNKVTTFIIRCLGRMLRLIPLYLVVLMIDWHLADQASTGPFWDYGDQATSERVLCQNSWWYNLLFINNFLPIKQQCMAWTWYLANDTQFFLLASLFLYITKFYSRKVGLFLISFTLVACGLATWIVSFVNGLNTGFADLIEGGIEKINPDSITPYLDLLYTKPYARIGPYFVGLLLGIILAEKSHFISRQLNLNAKVKWSVFFFSLSLITLALMTNYHLQLNSLFAAFYNSLSRLCWSIGLACLIIIFHSSQLGQSECIFESLNNFLSSNIFTPLANLTYCAYLVHPIVINFFYRTSLTPFIYTPSLMISLFFSNITCIYLVSVPLYLFIEAPITRMYKIIFDP